MINYLFYIYMFIMGAVFASFFGVIIARVPNNQSIVKPSSRCDECGHELKWYENVPIVSYICLKGRCSKCKTKIDGFYFIYEIIGGLTLLGVSYRYGISIDCLFVSFIALLLLLIAGYDYKTHYVLDCFLIILFVLCFIYFLYRVLVLKEDFIIYIISVICAILFFVLLRVIMSKIMNREAMGLGDVYLVGIMALILEPFEFVLAILFASLFGSIISIIRIKTNKDDRTDEIAFCPYLCFGFYMILIFGNKLVSLLLG